MAIVIVGNSEVSLYIQRKAENLRLRCAPLRMTTEMEVSDDNSKGNLK